MPGPTVENVCEMLALAHLHDVQKLKARAVSFIKKHADAVVKTEGWRELYKKPELVQFVICKMSGK
jgi:hypothetical protein